MHSLDLLDPRKWQPFKHCSKASYEGRRWDLSPSCHTDLLSSMNNSLFLYFLMPFSTNWTGNKASAETYTSNELLERISVNNAETESSPLHPQQVPNLRTYIAFSFHFALRMREKILHVASLLTWHLIAQVDVLSPGIVDFVISTSNKELCFHKYGLFATMNLKDKNSNFSFFFLLSLPYLYSSTFWPLFLPSFLIDWWFLLK